MPEAITEHWMGTDVYSTVIAYRTDQFENNAPEELGRFLERREVPGPARLCARIRSTRWSRRCWPTA